jgi:hypothetical protein
VRRKERALGRWPNNTGSVNLGYGASAKKPVFRIFAKQSASNQTGKSTEIR